MRALLSPLSPLSPLALLLMLASCAVGSGDGPVDGGSDGGLFDGSPGLDATSGHDAAQTTDAVHVGLGGDSGAPPDAGHPVDAGTDASRPDTGTGKPDTGSMPDTGGGTPDTGMVMHDAGKDVMVGACGGSGTLAKYTFQGDSGSEASVTPASQLGGVSAGSLTRSSTLHAVSGSDSINASGWTSAADTTRYFTFTVAPASGCSLTLTSVAIDTSASSTGPKKLEVATSVDGFVDHKSLSNGSSTVQLGGVSATSSVEVRIYGYGATSSGGTLRIQSTLSVTGSAQ